MKVSIRNLMMFMMVMTFGGAAAMAQHAGDVEITVESGQITTNSLVYGSDFGEAGIPNETDEPGFDALPGTFSASRPIGFNLLDTLRVWNGTDFSTIADETLGVTFSSLGPITTPTTADTVVPGFTINSSPEGEWHKHLIFTLNAPADTGVYLLKMEMFDGLGGLESSDPFYFVFNQNDLEANHDAAIAFVETSIVPEPGSFGLVMISGAMMLVRRRRMA